MASEGISVGKVPVNLDTALSLADGTSYVLLNKSYFRLFLILANAVPVPESADANLKEQFVEAQKPAVYKPITGMNLYGYYKSSEEGIVSSVEA